MANKHLHKYRLKDLNRKTDKPYLVYVCVKQECSHHIRIELVDGKLAECNRCGDPFIMKLAKLKHGERIIVKPHCDECTKTPEHVKKKKEELETSIEALMESILPKSLQ